MRANSMKSSTIIVTTLFVGAAGIIVAALFAAGKDTRATNKITRKGKLYKDYVIDKFYDFSDFVLHPIEKIEDKAIRMKKNLDAKAIMIKEESNQT
jgi:hypothetical protein